MASVDCSYSIKGSGPAVFFIHGIGARKTSWNGVCKYLEKDFTCISYDLRGHGDSPKHLLITKFKMKNEVSLFQQSAELKP